MSGSTIYLTFSRLGEKGTRIRGTRGHLGPVIAALDFERVLSWAEQDEIATAIRAGASAFASGGIAAGEIQWPEADLEYLSDPEIPLARE